MYLSSIAGFVSGALIFFAYLSYIKGIFAGTIKPSRTTWWIWSVMNFVTFAAYYSIGADETIWAPFNEAIGPLFIALLSVRYGVGGLRRSDVPVIAGASLCLGLWLSTGSAVLAFAAAIFVDFLGAVPTIVKAYRQEGEDTTPWLLTALGNGINILAVTAWTSEIALYPVYASLVSVTILFLLSRQKSSLRSAFNGAFQPLFALIKPR